jgi:hypothetical protein
MTETVADIARRAGDRLAPEYYASLPIHVEQALHNRDAQDQPDRYIDPVSIGGLIVSIASLAWTIYQDHKKSGNTPKTDVVARRVRVELATQDDIDDAQRDRIIDIVLEEISVAEQQPGK